MKAERDALQDMLHKYGDWFETLEYVVTKELIPDVKKLRSSVADIHAEPGRVGAEVLAIGLRLSRVSEKLEEAENSYRHLLQAAPTMINEGKKWLQGK